MKPCINNSSVNVPQFQGFCQVAGEMVSKRQHLADGTNGREETEVAFHQHGTIA